MSILNVRPELDPGPAPHDKFTMQTALERVTKDAMDLPPRQKLALAEFLLESAESAGEPVVESAWESEIGDRIRTVDKGLEKGTTYHEVMREAESRLIP